MIRFERGNVAIAVAALASHAFSLAAGFIWLDHAHLEQGLALAQSSGLGALFTHGFAGTGYYRPLMSLSLSLDAALGGAPLVYHVTTLLWHAAAALMVRVAGQELDLSRRAATGAALLFAVHPVTAVVANAIAFRSEAMIAVTLLGLLTAHVRGKAWASAALMCAGALTKETALVLGPLIALALELFGPAAATARAKPARLRLWGAEAFGLALALILRLNFAPAWRAGSPALSLDQAVGTRLASVAKSALALIAPIDISVCDAFPVSSSGRPLALAGMAALLGVAYLAWRRRGPALLLALTLVPSLQLVPVMRWWSPHYVYLPLAFASMLLVEAVERRSEPLLRGLAPLALALGGLTLLDARRYESDARFWSKEVKVEPRCREGHFYLGEAALAAERLDEAAAHYEQALTSTAEVLSYVDLPAALQNLGVVRLQQGRFPDAAQAFRRALEGKVDVESRRQLNHNLAVAELLDRRGRD
jgi:tetratricopeptide (TPR) repeat protein